MQYLLTEEEFRSLLAEDCVLIKKDKLQEFCTLNTTDCTINSLNYYCDGCTMLPICPYEEKRLLDAKSQRVGIYERTRDR
jgi:ABC-type antimicrobial peptide transport system ATPase subunit